MHLPLDALGPTQGPNQDITVECFAVIQDKIKTWGEAMLMIHAISGKLFSGLILVLQARLGIGDIANCNVIS